MARRKEPLREFVLIDWIRERTPRDPARVPIGIGDDAAAITTSPGRPVLVTVDMMLEGVHFDLKEATPRQVGRKAMAINLSDIAAMAGMPTAAVVSVGLKRSAAGDVARELYAGLEEMAAEFGVAVVGGDTTSWTKGLAVSVTVLGEPTGRGPVRRRGAGGGDAIVVTGSFGGSILGKHLAFTPRVGEAMSIHAMVELTAMIDASDGLAADLRHVLTESGCGAVLRAADVPVAEAAHQRSRQTGRTALEHALGDGEDFELIMTMPASSVETLLRHPPMDVPLSVIGYVAGDMPAGRIVLEQPDGSREDIDPSGYEHICGR